MKKNIPLVMAILLLLITALVALDYRYKYIESTHSFQQLQDELLRSSERNKLLEATLELSGNELSSLRGVIENLELYQKYLISQQEYLISQLPAGIWRCDDEGNKFIYSHAVKNPTLNKIISSLNNPPDASGLYIFLLGRSNNVAHIGVLRSRIATQTMGSTGARCYFGSIVNSITSLDDVDYVSLEIEEGSHFSPGIYDHIN